MPRVFGGLFLSFALHHAFVGPSDARPEFSNLFFDEQPECDLPVYSADEWRESHGTDLPDHPAVLRAGPQTSFPAMAKYNNFSALLQAFGSDPVDTQPGYAQAGGHLILLWPKSKVGWKGELRQIANEWNSSKRGWYHSEFNCRSHLCRHFAPDLGKVSPFGNLPARRFNFLVGGPGSGLPFHRHSATWQTLVNGRKAWFIVPPTHMGDELSEIVGPYIYPADAWDERVRGEPPGARPLRCVQYPGDQFFLPAMWWHATMNLDDGVVAYGLRPALTGREIEKMGAGEGEGRGAAAERWKFESGAVSHSATAAKLLAPFEPDPVPGGGVTDAGEGGSESRRRNDTRGGGTTLKPVPRWFDLIELQEWAAAAAAVHPSSPRTGAATLQAYEGVLGRVRGAVERAAEAAAAEKATRQEEALMKETASFTYCHLRAQLTRHALEGHPVALLGEELSHALDSWSEQARLFCPKIHALQCFEVNKDALQQGGMWAKPVLE